MSKFIAAMDHSGGSTGGVLERYGQEYTEEDKMDKVHAMRLRMVNSPDFTSGNIWAAILYKDSVDRGLHKILLDKGIEFFVKVDSGCKPDGTLKDFDLTNMINYANQHSVGAYGTKMRSVINPDENQDPIENISAIVEQQFQLAKQIAQGGLMPIIEPEIDINHKHKKYLEELLNGELEVQLANYKYQCILKLTPPEEPNLYYDLTLHPNVNRVVYLSGGYLTGQACNKLVMSDNVSASFSRGLSEDLFYSLTDDDFNATISSNIRKIKHASS